MSDPIDKLQSRPRNIYQCANGTFEVHAGIARVQSVVETCAVCLLRCQFERLVSRQMFGIGRRMGWKILCRVCYGCYGCGGFGEVMQSDDCRRLEMVARCLLRRKQVPDLLIMDRSCHQQFRHYCVPF